MTRVLQFLATLVLSATALLGQETHELLPDLGRFFDGFKAKGTFVLYDLEQNHWIRYNAERAHQRFLPASTFKIFNSLVALETGVIADENEIMRWDGVVRWNAAWNRDQTLRTAFQRSAVWVYQELARRIGERRMQEYLTREQYGNEDMSGGLDGFWLTGNIRISPDEQVQFLRKLFRGEVGFSARSVRIVKDIMLLEQSVEYTLRGKTGWAQPPGDSVSNIGWLVGWVEQKDNVYFFAMNLESSDADFPMVKARLEILYGILRKLGVLPVSG